MNIKKNLLIIFIFIFFILSFLYNDFFVYENVINEKYLIAINYDLLNLILNEDTLYLKPIQKTYIYLIESPDQNYLLKNYLIKNYLNIIDNKIYYYIIDYIIYLKKLV